jgi:hypothetical protein
MNSTIKQEISDLLKQLSNQIGELYHSIEEDTHIPEKEFKAYESKIEEIYSLHTQLEEVVYLSENN